MDYLPEDLPVFESTSHHRHAGKKMMLKEHIRLSIRSRDTTCHKKLVFSKNESRQRVAEAANLGKYLRAYKCPNCHLFHLSSKKRYTAV